jgi:hypothetical protein
MATPQAREAGWRACAAQADARAAALAPVVAEIRTSGITSPYSIAAALSARGIPTARGHRVWGDGPVRKLLNRVDRLAAAGAALGSTAVAMAREAECRTNWPRCCRCRPDAQFVRLVHMIESPRLGILNRPALTGPEHTRTPARQAANTGQRALADKRPVGDTASDLTPFWRMLARSIGSLKRIAIRRGYGLKTWRTRFPSAGICCL